jgi:hypothetical protein
MEIIKSVRVAYLCSYVSMVLDAHQLLPVEGNKERRVSRKRAVSECASIIADPSQVKTIQRDRVNPFHGQNNYKDTKP